MHLGRIEFNIVVFMDWSFASGCSPPRLSTTQLPSATDRPVFPSGRDFHRSVGAYFQAQLPRHFVPLSVDGAPEVVPFLNDPTGLIAATAAQDPYSMAEKAVTIGYDIIKAKKPAEAVTLIPVQFITKNNVSSYKGWTK